MHNGSSFTYVKPTLFQFLFMSQDLQIHLLVLNGVALCSYDFWNNPYLRHIFCMMTIIAWQLTGLAAIFKMAAKSNLPVRHVDL